MAQVTVGSTDVVPLAVKGAAVLHNLGPGILYIDADPDVTAETGFPIAVDGEYQFPRAVSAGGGAIFMIADADDTDVRTMRVG